MSIDYYLRDIEPLPGGMKRLRARLNRQPRFEWRPIGLAGSAVALSLTAVALLWAVPAIEERRLFNELEMVFREAKAPEVAINGQPLKLVGPTGDGAVIYWANDNDEVRFQQ